MRIQLLPWILLSISLFNNPVHAQFSILDTYGRNIDTAGITLVDWEGYMANPAILVKIKPTQGACFPLDVDLHVDCPRAYFEMPSYTNVTGAYKSITFNNAGAITVYLSIFPDEDALNKVHNLTIQSINDTSNFKISNPIISYCINNKL